MTAKGVRHVPRKSVAVARTGSPNRTCDFPVAMAANLKIAILHAGFKKGPQSVENDPGRMIPRKIRKNALTAFEEALTAILSDIAPDDLRGY